MSPFVANGNMTFLLAIGRTEYFSSAMQSIIVKNIAAVYSLYYNAIENNPKIKYKIYKICALIG